MSGETIMDRLLADLKQRFALGSLTYAEAVMIEDLIAAIAEINEKAEVNPAEGATSICPADFGDAEQPIRPHRL